MNIVEYNKQMKELENEIEKYDEKIDELSDKRHNCYAKKFQLEREYNAERLKNLKLDKENIVVGFAKNKDYHFQMIKAFVILSSGSARHIETIEQIYACNDFDYSYRCNNKNIALNDIVDMFGEFHVYVFSMDVYKELILQMTMLKVNVDNFDSIVENYATQAIQKISESTTQH